MEKPHRARELTLTIGANDDRDLVSALREFTLELQMGKLSGSGVSGSPSFGWIYEIKRDDAMTKEAYLAAVDEYLSKTPTT